MNQLTTNLPEELDDHLHDVCQLSKFAQEKWDGYTQVWNLDNMWKDETLITGEEKLFLVRLSQLEIEFPNILPLGTLMVDVVDYLLQRATERKNKHERYNH